MLQKHFVSLKIFTLIAYSKMDLTTLCLKTEEKELQMDVVLMHLEEAMDIKLNKSEVSLFKKEFDNFFLVPLRTIENKILMYKGSQLHSNYQKNNTEFYVSLIYLMNRILLEWEKYQE